jgi:hypothetical protein
VARHGIRKIGIFIFGDRLDLNAPVIRSNPLDCCCIYAF